MTYPKWIVLGFISLSLTLLVTAAGLAQSAPVASDPSDAAPCVTPLPLAAIATDLPQAITRELVQAPALIISLDAVGQTYIDQSPVTPDQLRQTIQQFQQETPDGEILLAASRSALYDDVVRVLDVLRAVGGDRVGLMVATEPSPTRIPLQIPPPSEPLPTLPPLRPSDRPPQLMQR